MTLAELYRHCVDHGYNDEAVTVHHYITLQAEDEWERLAGEAHDSHPGEEAAYGFTDMRRPPK